MQSFERYAAAAVMRDCAFVGLAGLIMMIGLSFNPVLAFKTGALVAIANALFLMLRSDRLTDERVALSEAWQNLEPAQRPARPQGRAVCRRALEETFLTFAKGSACVAIVLSSAAFIVGQL